MRVKIFEVRDEGTHIEVFAISTEPSNPEQVYGLLREGFIDGGAVILGYLHGEQPSSADPYFWRGRTMQAAHVHITDNFETLVDGQVIDVRVLLGEATEPVQSDRYFQWRS